MIPGVTGAAEPKKGNPSGMRINQDGKIYKTGRRYLVTDKVI